MAEKTKKQQTQTEESNIAETNVAPSVGTSTSTVIGNLPNLDETQSPTPAPLVGGEPVGAGESLVQENESASQTENVNPSQSEETAQGNETSATASNDLQADEKSVKGGEMRVAAGIHKGRKINEDGTINMKSPTERERRVAAQKREANQADSGESQTEAAA